MSEAVLPSNAPAGSPVEPAKKHRPWWRKLLRLFFWLSGGFVLLILVLLVLTWIYQDDVKNYVVQEVNKRVNTTILIDPKDIDITIIRSFPDVSVEFRRIAALDAINIKKRDTLFNADLVSLKFNIVDLFHANYSIHNITMKDATVNMWTDEKGNDNYHFLKEDTTAATNDSSHVAFALNEILLENVSWRYDDRKAKNNYNIHLKKLKFSGDFGKEQYDFSTESDFTINKLLVGNASFFAGNSGSLHLVMNVDNTSGTYALQEGKMKISDLLVDISGNAKEQGKNYALDLVVKGEDIDLPAALSLLPASYHEDLGDLESSGEFFVNGTVKGLYGDSTLPVVKAQFGVNPGATIGRKKSDVKFTDVSMKGLFSNEKGKEQLNISSFSLTAAKSRFQGSFSMSGFKRPRYETKLSGRIDLGEMQELLRIDTIENVAGTMSLAFEGSGKPTASVPTVSDFRTFKTSGKIGLNNVLLKLRGAKDQADSINGDLSFDGNNVAISHFTARKAGSDITLNGNVRNLLGYIFTDKEVLDISGDLSSRNLDLTRLLQDESASSSSDTNYHLELPARLRLKVNASVKHLSLDRFDATDIAGNVTMSKQRLVCDPVSFHAMDGSFTGSGMIDDSQKNDSLLITCNADIKDVNISKLFWQCYNFGQDNDDEEDVITDKNVKGRLTAQVNFASVWGSDLNINDKKIYTDADISISQGELINFKPLEVLSRFIKLEDLKDIRFQNLSNHIGIRNRVIDIPKMQINSNAINITMSGTHDFDNIVNYHFIVDLDELRAKKAKAARKENSEFGEEIDDGGHRTRLFISMKGSIEDPDISYDRKGAIQQLKEDLHQEKQDLKKILNEEFGWFGKDKPNKDDRKKDDGSSGKFILKQDDDTMPADNPAKKKKKPKDEELDGSGDY